MADGAEISRPSSRLSESWDDIVYEKRHEDDQQSENSLARSLIRKNHEDGDIESLDERDTVSDVADDESTGSAAEHHIIPFQYEEATLGSGQDQSGSMTAKPTYSQLITFQEVASSKTDVELKHILNPLNEADIQHIIPALSTDSDQLFSSVNMTASAETLDIDRPLRLLYVGNPDQRSAILAKFGDALMAGKKTFMEESRYHVLPTSADFNGPTELVPIQAQIVVDECITAASVKDSQLLHEQIYLRFKKGQQSLFSSTWTGKGDSYRISPSAEWSAPDIAVLYFSAKHDVSVSSQEYEVMQERLRLASKFLNRHGVPVVMLSEDPMATLPVTFPVNDKHTLRACIESRTRGQLRSFPLDLEAFENLDSIQLNAHLAYLLQRKELSGSKTSSLTANASMLLPKYVRDIEKNLSKSLYQRDQQVREFFEQRSLQVSALLIFTLLTSVFAYAMFWLMTPAPLPNRIDDSRAATSNAPTAIVTSTAIDAPEVLIQPSPVSVAVATQAVTSLSTINKEQDVLKTAIGTLTNRPIEPERFVVERVLDGNLILINMPPSLIKRGRIPTFHVEIKRGDQNVDFKLTRVFDNVFSVGYDEGEMFGKLSINIIVDKPYQTETHEIDYGYSWLNAYGWKHSAKEVIDSFGSGLKSLDQGIPVALDKSLERASQKVENVHKKAMETFKSQQLRAASNAHAVSRKARDSIATYSQTTSELAQAYAVNAWAVARSKISDAASKVGMHKEQAFRLTPEYLAMAQKRAQQIKREAKAAYSRKLSDLETETEVIRSKVSVGAKQQGKKARRA